MTDTVYSAASALISMSDADYILLLMKLGGILGGMAASVAAGMVAVYKFGSWLWAKMLASLRVDLAVTFCPMQDVNELKQQIKALSTLVSDGFKRVDDRLESGDRRMDGIASDVSRAMRVAVGVASESDIHNAHMHHHPAPAHNQPLPTFTPPGT